MQELVVLSILEEDIIEYCDEGTLEKLKERGLVYAAMEKAREYMWDSIDNTDMFVDCIEEAIANVVKWSEGR